MDQNSNQNGASEDQNAANNNGNYANGTNQVDYSQPSTSSSSSLAELQEANAAMQPQHSALRQQTSSLPVVAEESLVYSNGVGHNDNHIEAGNNNNDNVDAYQLDSQQQQQPPAPAPSSGYAADTSSYSTLSSLDSASNQFQDFGPAALVAAYAELDPSQLPYGQLVDTNNAAQHQQGMQVPYTDHYAGYLTDFSSLPSTVDVAALGSNPGELTQTQLYGEEASSIAQFLPASLHNIGDSNSLNEFASQATVLEQQVAGESQQANLDESQATVEGSEDKKEQNDANEQSDDEEKFELRRQRGVAESGSFKRLGSRTARGDSSTWSSSKLKETSSANNQQFNDDDDDGDYNKENENDDDDDDEYVENEEEAEALGGLPKFKRTHSVSFNVKSSGRSRHSVDIRNLPSYLHHKRASIVDVAKGAMSSLFGSGGGPTGSSSQSLEPAISEDPIFVEPIAPTLSLGQRVAMVRNDGSEFGTVGWIGRLEDFDKDWVVGVVFDNEIGDCDGEYQGTRYFYARKNYAMFVPLSTLTKTDNYIGRPETGTMLSRMSVQLKPGQLISIQRSSIRLQHCFLNAPHQRVGHDVRAVSNRLHCQCHNCGPCAHLTKQGRGINAMPGFMHHGGGGHAGGHGAGGHKGAGHGAGGHKGGGHGKHKSNSLAHAAVEILAHHHHHEEHDLDEAHEDDDYRFGDNSAHACNFVRYSCCVQAQSAVHQPASDCSMVRPEILDNLITAPRAPTTTRPISMRTQRRRRGARDAKVPDFDGSLALGDKKLDAVSNCSGSEHSNGLSSSSQSSCSSSSLDDEDNEVENINNNQQQAYFDNNKTEGSVFSTINTQISIADQRRFIYQRDSSAYVNSQTSDSNYSDGYYNNRGGLVSRVRNCLRCIVGRGDGNRQRRSGKRRGRKLSRMERALDYRRRNSTFVPSTLAKPQDDFASHGFSNYSNSNYNYDTQPHISNLSQCASPDNFNNNDSNNNIDEQQQSNQYQRNLVMSYQIQNNSNANPQILLRDAKNGNVVELDTQRRVSFETNGIKDDEESDLTKHQTCKDTELSDLGFYESQNDSSETLKKIVEKDVNAETGEWLPTAAFDLGVEMNREDLQLSSPTSSADTEHYDNHIQISSPTISVLSNSANVTDLNDSFKKMGV